MKNPWYKRFGGDFIQGTVGLTLEHVGAYTLIIDMIHDRGKPLPDDDRFMAGLLRVSTRKWRSIREVLISAGKIYASDGIISNERCDRDLAEAAEISRRHAENGARGGRAKRRSEPVRQVFGADSGIETGSNQSRNSDELEEKGNEINENDEARLKPTRSQKPEDIDSVPKGTGAEAPIDIAKAVFDAGVQMLTAAGKTEAQARSMVGKWRKDFTDAEVMRALSSAQRSNASEPVSYVTEALKRSSCVYSVGGVRIREAV